MAPLHDFTTVQWKETQSLVVKKGPNKVVNISSSILLLAVGSRVISQAEKEITSCKAKQIHKMTIIFTQNDPKLSFCEFV